MTVAGVAFRAAFRNARDNARGPTSDSSSDRSKSVMSIFVLPTGVSALWERAGVAALTIVLPTSGSSAEATPLLENSISRIAHKPIRLEFRRRRDTSGLSASSVEKFSRNASFGEHLVHQALYMLNPMVVFLQSLREIIFGEAPN